MNGFQCAFIGRLGQDAELRYSGQGSPFVTFSVAAHDSNRGDRPVTEWCRVILFGSAAEQLAPVLVKGVGVYVEGRLRLWQGEGQNGVPRAGLDITARKVELLGLIGGRAPAERQASKSAAPSPDRNGGPLGDLCDLEESSP